MLTFLVRISLLAELAAWLVLGTWLKSLDNWGPGTIPATAVVGVLGVRLVLVLATSLHGWIHRSPREPVHRLGLAGTLELLATEYAAMLADNLFYLPFESLAVRPDPAPAPGGPAPVILLHGYLSNRGYFRPMVRWLEARGVSAIFVPNYRSVFSSIETGVATLHAEIERVARATGQRVVLVCHSMGGLIARRYLQDHGEERISRLVTIASPHHGSEIAKLGFGPHARQMERGSEFLAALARAETAKPPGVPTVSIYTVHDNLVSPQDTSRLAWARNEALAGRGHVGVLLAERTFPLVLDELRKAGALQAP